MKSLVLAYEWCEKIMAGRTVNPDSIRELATAIDKHFVSREDIAELRKQCDAVVEKLYAMKNNASGSGNYNAVVCLGGEIAGVKQVISYLAEMEATE